MAPLVTTPPLIHKVPVQNLRASFSSSSSLSPPHSNQRIIFMSQPKNFCLTWLCLSDLFCFSGFSFLWNPMLPHNLYFLCDGLQRARTSGYDPRQTSPLSFRVGQPLWSTAVFVHRGKRREETHSSQADLNPEMRDSPCPMLAGLVSN